MPTWQSFASAPSEKPRYQGAQCALILNTGIITHILGNSRGSAPDRLRSTRVLHLATPQIRIVAQPGAPTGDELALISPEPWRRARSALPGDRVNFIPKYSHAPASKDSSVSRKKLSPSKQGHRHRMICICFEISSPSSSRCSQNRVRRRVR